MPRRPDRIVVDTNLWISYLLTNRLNTLDAFFDNDDIDLLFSSELLIEFVEVAQRPKFKKYFSIRDLEDLLLRLREHAVLIKVSSTVDICRDYKDNFLLALAQEGKATYLITGDKDLLVLKTFRKTKIVMLRDYLTRNEKTR